jgi:hypothetical protein
LSFFDEADEPRTTPRSAARSRSRPAPRGRRPTGGGGRGPGDQQSIQVRRAIAAVAVLIVLILIVLGVHSCQISARNSSLKDYTNNVSSLIQQSDQTGQRIFALLSGGTGASNATGLQNQINQTRVAADAELAKARALDVPSEVSGAQQNQLLTLEMRRDGIANIATEIQPALGNSTSKDAINAIAAEMARFYASDAVYKDYTVPLIVAALHSAGIPVGGTNGESIESGQFLPNLGWLTPAFVAAKLGAQAPAANGGKIAPGTHGHSLSSVSVGGTTLQTGSTNTIPANPAPKFTLNFTNAGQNTENNVICKVTMTGDSGQTVVPQTTAGQTTSCDVTLNSPPPAGTVTVTAQIVPVPGEQNIANNSMSFPVTFQ